MYPVEFLSDEQFLPFGKIIKPPAQKPDGSAISHDYWDQLAVLTGETSINYLIAKKRDFILSQMERHVKTPEFLVLLEGSCLLPVAPAGDFNEAKIKVFRLNAGDAVLLNSGTWHWVPFSFEDISKWLVVYAAGTPKNDMDFADLSKPLIMKD